MFSSPPYDDRRIVAGAATLGLELLRQVASLGTALDTLVVNCLGGGLTAGCALARNALSRSTTLVAVEPEAFDDTSRSLKLGMRVRNDPSARSICDALQSPMPGRLTFKINREAIDACVCVTDAEVVALEEFGLVVEPGAAASLAAVLSGKFSITDNGRRYHRQRQQYRSWDIREIAFAIRNAGFGITEAHAVGA